MQCTMHMYLYISLLRQKKKKKEKKKSHIGNQTYAKIRPDPGHFFFFFQEKMEKGSNKITWLKVVHLEN